MGTMEELFKAQMETAQAKEQQRKQAVAQKVKPVSSQSKTQFVPRSSRKIELETDSVTKESVKSEKKKERKPNTGVRKSKTKCESKYLRDFPAVLVTEAVRRYPDAQNQTDAVAACLYSLFQNPDLAGVPEHVRELAGTYTEDAVGNLADSYHALQRQYQNYSSMLKTLEMGMSVLLLDRMGQLPVNLNAGVPISRDELAIEEVIDMGIRMRQQAAVYKDRVNRKEGPRKQ